MNDKKVKKKSVWIGDICAFWAVQKWKKKLKIPQGLAAAAVAVAATVQYRERERERDGSDDEVTKTFNFITDKKKKKTLLNHRAVPKNSIFYHIFDLLSANSILNN